MYTPVQTAFHYLRYLLNAGSGKGHGIHSPFVYDFVEKVLRARETPEAFARIEALRDRLRTDGRTVAVLDLGAGSATDNAPRRRVGDIARRAAKPAKYARLLHRLCSHYRRTRVLELGTSLGISAAYMAGAPSVESLVTLEGAPEIAALAGSHFEELGLMNIRQIVGDFDETLEAALAAGPAPDMFFFDGNHRKEPTLRYFHRCRAQAGEDAIFVFDDIHWSREMEEAWEALKAAPEVTCTIDLFFVGIVLVHPRFRERVHFTIRY